MESIDLVGFLGSTAVRGTIGFSSTDAELGGTAHKPARIASGDFAAALVWKGVRLGRNTAVGAKRWPDIA
jgi:hypothetical protein